MRVYTPLELAGRNIYIREGCYACHSQMIRTLARRGRALRPLFAGGGIEIRPSDAVGLEAHRPGSRPHRRQIFRRLARRASDQSARRRAGIGDAEIWLAAAQCARGPTISASISRRMRAVGVPYTDEMIANATADAFGQAAPDSHEAGGVTERYGEATNVRAFDGDPGRADRDGCARRLSAGARPADRCRRQAGQTALEDWTMHRRRRRPSPRAGGSST